MTTDLPDSALELRSTGDVARHAGAIPARRPGSRPPPPTRSWYGWRRRRSTRRTWVVLIAGADLTTATVDGHAGAPGRHGIVGSGRPGGPLGARRQVASRGQRGCGHRGGRRVVGRRRRPCSGRRWAIAGGAMYSQYRAVDAAACLVLPEGATARGRRVVVRQSADGARNGGNHAPRRSFGAGAHRCGVQSRPDARQAVPGGRGAAGQHRPQVRAGGAAAFARRGPCLQLGRRRRSRRTSSRRSRRRPRRWRSTRPAAGRWQVRSSAAWRTAASSTAAEYSRYGSTVHKQVYIYGGLDTGPTVLTRNFGMAWGVGGWLLTPFLQSAGRRDHWPTPGAGGRGAHHDLREHLHP